ncbi:MAG: ATP-dependent Clp protease proteolytic subunit, partial [Gemmataceae bacterium]
MFHLPFEPQAAATLPGPLNPVMSNGYTRQRSMTLSDLLLENRIIFIGSSPETQGVAEINDWMSNITIQKMLWLATEKKTADIHMYINSPGGSLSAGLAIYDAMQFVGCPINTYCMGTAASMAAVLLAAGTKGKRYALPNSKVLIHQPRIYEGIQGQVTDLEIYAAEIQKEKERMNQILA